MRNPSSKRMVFILVATLLAGQRFAGRCQRQRRLAITHRRLQEQIPVAVSGHHFLPGWRSRPCDGKAHLKAEIRRFRCRYSQGSQKPSRFRII